MALQILSTMHFFFFFFFNILLGTAITLIFLNRFQGTMVSLTLTWCNKANVASTDHVASQ